MAKLSAYGGHEVARYKGLNGFVMVLVVAPERSVRILVKYTAEDSYHVTWARNVRDYPEAQTLGRQEFARREALHSAAAAAVSAKPAPEARS